MALEDFGVIAPIGEITPQEDRFLASIALGGGLIRAPEDRPDASVDLRFVDDVVDDGNRYQPGEDPT